MATIFDIPEGDDQIKDTGRMLIRSFGLQLLKTQIYKPGIASAERNAQAKSKDSTFEFPQDQGRDEPIGQSYLGTPVFSNLLIESGNYYDENGILTTYPSIRIDTCLFTVGMQKVIVSTPVQGRNGSVKQYISDKDYFVNIKGLICGTNGKFPKEDFHNLLRVLKANAALSVKSWFLNDFSIFNLVIDNYEIQQEMGRYSTVPFNINCISDQPIEFELLK